MNLVSLKCPNCNANITVDNGLDQFYCSHCGGLIIADELSPDAYRARVRIKELEREADSEEKQISHEKFMTERYCEDSKEERKAELKKGVIEGLFSDNGFAIVFVLILVIAAAASALFLGVIPRAREDRRIASVEEELNAALDNEEYEEALVLVNELVYPESLSSDEAEKWTAKREQYLEIIEGKLLEDAQNDPNTIFAPDSSKNMEGEDAEEIKVFLENAGFTNVSLTPAAKKAGLFRKKNTVEHIAIGGQVEFTAEDYFQKDVEIIVYYYSK